VIKLSLQVAVSRRKVNRVPLTEYVESLLGKVVVIYGNPGTGKSTFIARLAKILKQHYGKPAKLFWADLMLAKDNGIGPWLRRISQADTEVIRWPWELEYKLRHLNARDYSLVAIDSVSGLYEAIEGSVTGPRIALEMKRWASKYARMLLEKIVYGDLKLAILVHHESALFGGDFYGEPVKPNISLQILKNVDVVLRTYVETKETKEGTLRYYYIKYVMYRALPTQKNYENYKLLQDDFLGEKFENLKNIES